MSRIVKPLSSIILAKELDLDHFGSEVIINRVCSYSNICIGSLSFSVDAPHSAHDSSVIITSNVEKLYSGIVSDNPRLDFIRVINWLNRKNLFSKLVKGAIHRSAIIHPTSIIDDDVNIGKNSVVGPNCCLMNGTSIGSNVKVGANSVIGHDGFGYEIDDYGIPIHFPHLGRVFVSDNVTIGNLCTIARGTINDTNIDNDVKIDDHVYIAHNVSIGKNTMLMSGSKVCGSVNIGNSCWIGTGAMIRESINIYDNAMVGIGSVVVKNVNEKSTIMGNPAK